MSRPMANQPRVISHRNATTARTSPRADARARSATPIGLPPARVMFGPALPRHGATAGGWWPRSRNAPTELPALIAALDARPGVDETLDVAAGRSRAGTPARIISADGEYQASKKLAQAATVMAADPAALQLRLLQTVVEVAAEKNSTLVIPVPVELLRFFDRAPPPPSLAEPPAADAQDPGASLPVPGIPALPVPASVALTAPLNAAPKTPAAV
jgi:uncharacterized protein DUF5994